MLMFYLEEHCVGITILPDHILWLLFLLYIQANIILMQRNVKQDGTLYHHGAAQYMYKNGCVYIYENIENVQYIYICIYVYIYTSRE